jgi:hypothetical protein
VFLQDLDWSKTANDVESNNLLHFLGEADYHIDHENDTVEWQHPFELLAQANTEDNPPMEEAMSGPNKAGYWKAMEVERASIIWLIRPDWDKEMLLSAIFHSIRIPKNPATSPSTSKSIPHSLQF